MFENLGTALSFGTDLLNYGLQREQYEYQKQLNNTQMSREDSAWQRAVADAEKAGISKAQLGSGASSSALTSASAPQLKMDAQQRILNRLSMTQAQADISRSKAEADSAQQMAEYNKTVLGASADAEKAKLEWIQRNPGIAVAGYPSPMNAVTGLIVQGLDKWLSAHPNLPATVTQEVQQLKENVETIVESTTTTPEKAAESYLEVNPQMNIRVPGEDQKGDWKTTPNIEVPSWAQNYSTNGYYYKKH